ncbi:type II secretion system GspH family protein [bacterium]|nr:type II secretion system GspH family protein [bacterium]
MQLKNYQKQKGLSLVEVLVSFAIFGIIAAALMAIFTSTVNTQAVILQHQAIMNEANFAIDYMGRAIRLARVDDATGGNGACTGTLNANYSDTVSNPNQITFLSYDPMAGGGAGMYCCRRFQLVGEKIYEFKSSDTSASNFPTSGTEITSGQVKVSSLKFIAQNRNRTDYKQPMVTINIDILPTGRQITPIPEIKVQTTLSQRNLNTIE